MQNTLDELHDRPPQDWYTQDNLEAANSLKELTEQSMNALAQDLGQADASVEAMRDKAENPNDASSLQPMQDQLRAAEENLASGNFPLNRELVQQLKSGEAAADKQLSASQLAALHERLKKGELAAQTAPKSNGALSEEMQKAMADAAMGKGAGRGELVPGSGGLGGGKKSAPLELQARDKDTPDGNLTQVASDDMKSRFPRRYGQGFRQRARGRSQVLSRHAGRRHCAGQWQWRRGGLEKHLRSAGSGRPRPILQVTAYSKSLSR